MRAAFRVGIGAAASLALALLSGCGANEADVDELSQAFDAPGGASGSPKTDERLRLRALEVLGASARSTSPDIRATAADGLGASRSKSAGELAAQLLSDPSASVRASAAAAIGLTKPGGAAKSLIAKLSDPDDRVGDAAAWALTMVPSARVTAELRRIALGPGDSRQRQRAVLLLGRMKSKGTEALLAGLTASDNAAIAAAAAAALGYLGDGRGIASLSRFADAGFPIGVRLIAAEGFSRVGSPVAVVELRKMLSDDPSPRVRAAAASGLGIAGAEGSVWQLLHGMSDSSVRVRIAAAEALGRLGDERAIKVLRKSLMKGPAWAKARAARALGSFKTDAARDALAAAARSPDGLVAVHALGSLTKMGESGSAGRLRLAKLLDDPKSHVRVAAAVAVMKLLDPGRLAASGRKARPRPLRWAH